MQIVLYVCNSKTIIIMKILIKELVTSKHLIAAFLIFLFIITAITFAYIQQISSLI